MVSGVARAISLVLSLVVTGCINITAHLTPPNETVQGSLIDGSDCVPIILGLGIGTADVKAAMQKTAIIKQGMEGRTGEDGPPIRLVRSVALTDYQFLFFGARCVEVTGLP